MDSCCNVVQRDCEIMMTLDLDVWQLLCSREEFFSEVTILVGTKQMIQEIPIRNDVLRR